MMIDSGDEELKDEDENNDSDYDDEYDGKVS
jgi:hypothetical protein